MLGMYFFGDLILFGGVIGFLNAIAASFLVGYMYMFEKAGISGWKAFIPVYNTYILYKIAWNVKYFWITIALVVVILLSGHYKIELPNILSYIVLVIIQIMAKYKLAKVFGKGILFTLGLIVMEPICFLILGLDGSEYSR